MKSTYERKEILMISVCIIGKNESKVIEHCLKSIKPYGYEIIYTDTGSTDNTKDIAAKYTDKIYDYEWCNDFSAARNFCCSKASSPFILVLDCDEYIETLEKEHLEKLISTHTESIGRIKRINPYIRNGETFEMHEHINRIFPNELYRYSGTIHEQIVPVSSEITENTYIAPVTIRHTGYDGSPEALKEKAMRNISLLLEELNTNEKNPYILYQLGKSYYMLQDYETACTYFSEGLCFDLDPALEYVQDMVESYGYALINSKRAEEALSFENIYNEFANNADFIFLMGLIYMNNGMFDNAIQEFKKATDTPNYKMKGVNSFIAYYNIGVIYECLNHKSEAIHYYTLSKKYGYHPAMKRLGIINGV